MASIWLIGQCSVFVRNRDRLAEPPIGLQLDEAMVEWLGDAISRWVVAGLGRAQAVRGRLNICRCFWAAENRGNVPKIP